MATSAQEGYIRNMQQITHAQIEPTTRCNFTCGFCAGRSMVQGNLDWKTFVRFLDAHPGLAHVELQGEGEPMLHARFFDMVGECRARGIRVGVITNGSLLNDDRVERLLAAGIHSVHVSLESADSASFAAIRGGSFYKVRDGLARLARRRRELGLQRPAIGLTVTVLKDTIDAIGGIHLLYRELGLDGGIVVQPLQVMPAYRRRYGLAMSDQILPPALVPRFTAIGRALRQVAPVRRTEDFFYHSLFADFGADSVSCPWLERGAYLAQDGRITGCCFMKDESFGGLDDPHTAAGRRAELSESLSSGAIPDACRGCATAAIVARRHAQAVSAPLS